MKRLLAGLVAIWFLGAPLAARADEAPPPAPTGETAADAKRLYQEGNTHFNLGEYDKAAEKFKEAYRISKKPLLLYNIAQAYRLAGDHEHALIFYRNFLNAMPEADSRAEVEQYIKDLEALVASEQASRKQPPTGTVPPDGEHVKIPPPDHAVLPPAGPPAAGLPEHHDTARPIYKKWWFWAGIGAVAVGATVLAVTAGGGGRGEPGSSLGTSKVY